MDVIGGSMGLADFISSHIICNETSSATSTYGAHNFHREIPAVSPGGPSMDALGQNLKFAARQLLRNPGFTVTVIITLALSIGANTANFSLVNALMLKSLPYSHPERLGTIYTRITGS